MEKDGGGEGEREREYLAHDATFCPHPIYVECIGAEGVRGRKRDERKGEREGRS
jgi:hypothetical protein